MTYEEARDLLSDMRAAKRRAQAIKARIADLEDDAVNINSSLGGDITHGGISQSRVEQLVIRIESEREKYITVLEAYFKRKDILMAAIDMLEPMEKEIILAFYMDNKPLWKIAKLVNYSIETVCRKKNSGIRKIADFL